MDKNFNPASWLFRWREAGGGWATEYLIRPRNTGDQQAMAAMTRELSDDQRAAVMRHIREAAA